MEVEKVMLKEPREPKGIIKGRKVLRRGAQKEEREISRFMARVIGPMPRLETDFKAIAISAENSGTRHVNERRFKTLPLEGRKPEKMPRVLRLAAFGY